MIDVSVIIPIFNVEKYLCQCIESVIKQSYANMEIILVNDGSTDNSFDICEKYKYLDNVVLIDKENGGLSSARNAGLKVAKGRYILFLDSDDFYEDNNFIERLLSNINDDTDLVLFPYKKYYDNGSMEIVPIVGDYDNLTYNQMIDLLMKTNSFKSSACTKLILKDNIINNNIYFYDNIHSEDIEWSLNILIHSKSIKVNNDVFYIYRQQRKESISSNFLLKSFNDYIGILERSINDIKSKKANKVLFSYLCYQYCILLGYANTFLESNVITIDSLLKYTFLFNYAKDLKSKLVKLIYRLFGLKFSIKFLGFIIDLKK